jgi:hypothetical protein
LTLQTAAPTITFSSTTATEQRKILKRPCDASIGGLVRVDLRQTIEQANGARFAMRHTTWIIILPHRWVNPRSHLIDEDNWSSAATPPNRPDTSCTSSRDGLPKSNLPQL